MSPRDIHRIPPSLFRGLAPEDREYFRILYVQFLNPPRRGLLRIGKNFLPSATLTAKQRRIWMNAVGTGDLRKKSRLWKKAARRVTLQLCPMNGGIGTSIKRERHLMEIWSRVGYPGAPRLGSKGSDLHFSLRRGKKTAWVSISEAKLLQAIHASRSYRKLIVEPLASQETEHSIRRVLDTPNVFSRLGRSSSWGRKSYRRIFESHPRLALKATRIQAVLPTLDPSGRLTRRYRAPGGHAYWGVRLLLGALESRVEIGDSRIAAIYNEDGINNTVDPVIVGWMAQNRIPAVMLTTTKTPLDKKGGLLGIVRSAGRPPFKEILEEAQAVRGGDVPRFYKVGLERGEEGRQFFNTNTALLNLSVLGPLLRDLEKEIGRDSLLQGMSPALILNSKAVSLKGRSVSFTQLEGAIGSCLVHLDGFLSNHPRRRVKALLKKHGIVDRSGTSRFLWIVNAKPEERLEFFTPVKSAFDFWLQFFSGLFRLDPIRWRLRPRRRTRIPRVALSRFYDDVTDVLEVFGTPGSDTGACDIRRLRDLEISGRAFLPGAALAGQVRIQGPEESPVDLNSPGIRPHIPRKGGKAFLENVRIAWGTDGVVVKKL